MTEDEKHIAGRIHDFDILPLLRLLGRIGYPPEVIRFCSHNSICSQRGLIEAIRFVNGPTPEAHISMNFGLLSVQSPLPSYFRKRLEDDLGSAKDFETFCGFFDHQLIWNYICNLYPELDQTLFPSWQANLERYLHIVDLKSTSALHWLFQLVFPELLVAIEATVLTDNLKTVPLVLGKTIMGREATFGSSSAVPVCGRTITLFAETELSDCGNPWPREVERRMNVLIFPVLHPTGVFLEIDLVLQDQKRWVQLTPQTYLGYDRIRNGTTSFRRIQIFRGNVAERAVDTSDRRHNAVAKRVANEM
jgi:hypothetical protein